MTWRHEDEKNNDQKYEYLYASNRNFIPEPLVNTPAEVVEVCTKHCMP